MTRLVCIPALPGSLLKRPQMDSSRKRLSMGRAPRVVDGNHTALIRLLPCLRCGMEPCGVAAHLRLSSAQFNKRIPGTRNKPDDKWTLPLCEYRECHPLQHALGEVGFWDDLKLNPFEICEALHAATGDQMRMRAIVFTFIARIPASRRVG